MRNLKKFLALVLAMVMAFSLMLTANAVTTGTQYSDASGVTPAFEEAVDVLTGMKVFQGDAEAPTFRPASSITRAEVAAIIYRLVTGDVTDSQAHLYTTQHPYTDVRSDAWYAGYVGYLHNAKIIKGTTATTFNPADNVTGYEALAMILRAVGYDKNNEFTGSTWRVEVASTSKTLGILKDVDTTIYGGTLHLAARRDVVASLLFNTAAYVPMVQYTLAFGYQDTGMEGGVVGSTKNPTLGYKIFGLTSNTGVVVGNEVTGESKGTTKIGFSLASARTASDLSGIWNNNSGGTVTWGTINTNQTAFATAIDDNMTINHRTAGTNGNGDAIAANYTSAYNYESDTTNILPGNVTRSFKFSTDLRMFNHAVKVWYDNRSSQYETVGNGYNGTAQFTTNLTTYAYFDKAVATAVVTTEDFTSNNSAPADANLDGKLGTLVGGRTNSVANNWNAPAFSMRKNAGGNNVAYFNYSFARMSTADYGTDVGTAGTVDTNNQHHGPSPVKKNDDNGVHGLYLLISNTEGKVLDVVIPLEITMTQITQANSTTDPYSVGVLAANEAAATDLGANHYFGIAADKGMANVVGTTTNYVSLAQANLKNDLGKDIVTTLGTKVAAIAISGTNGGNVPTGTVGTADSGYAANRSPLTSTFYYQLTENTLKRTATVIKVDYATQDVTLSDGTVLHQSVFAEATDGTFIPEATAGSLAGIEASTDDAVPQMILSAGRDYTFTLDEQGNYIYWNVAANTAKFVYGTYIDYTTRTASSSFDYPLVYVGTDGKLGQQNILHVKGEDDEGNALDAAMSASTYDALGLPKRDNASAGNTSGYQRGWYIGYALDSNGNLVAVTPTNSQNTGFVQATEANNFGANAITINKTDVAITAKEVADGSNLFLTGNTQFYLVDGAGTDNQKVTPYKGLTELMAGMDSVVIDVSTATSRLTANRKYLAAADGTPENPWEMVYYQPGNFEYAQNYDPSAKEIKTVFIPAEAVTFNKSIDNTLVFVGDNTSTLVSAVGEKATQFTMYRNGEAANYWVQGHLSTDGDASDVENATEVILDNGKNVFYSLVETGKTAADGQPIYTVRGVANANSRIVGKYFTVNGWNGTAFVADSTDLTQVSIDSVLTDVAGLYKATTYSSQVAILTYDGGKDVLYNVGNAGVKNLDKDTYPGIVDTLGTLNNAGSLINNVGVPVSCILDTADTTGRTVSFIYVNAYVAP